MAKAIETLKEFQNLNEKDLIFIDIETARGVKELKGSHLEDAWHYKARYQNELNRKTGKEYTVEEYFMDKSPLYPPFGRVVTIVVGRIKENKIYLKSYANENEKELLEAFDKDLNKVYEANPNSRLVSFKGVVFDIPFIDKRYIVNGIKGCPLITEEKMQKPWLVGAIDIGKIWQGNGMYPDSLIAVSSCLGLPSPKDALDGSMVSEAFWSGRIDEIVTYCKKDVEVLCRIFRKMTFKEDLEDGYEDMDEVKVSIPLLEKIKAAQTVSEEDEQKIISLNLSDKEKENTLIILKSILPKKVKLSKELEKHLKNK